MFLPERGLRENRKVPILLRNSILSRPEALTEPHIVFQNHPGSKLSHLSTQLNQKCMQHSNPTSIVLCSRGAGKFDMPDPLIDSVVSFLTKSSTHMSDNEDDDVLLSNLEGEFDQLTSIWECDD
jgi:hypothetical protein